MTTLAPPVTRSAQTELTATVRSVIWSDWSSNPAGGDSHDATGAFIVRVRTNGDADAEHIVKGQCPEGDIEVGLAYRFIGKWSEHHKYGRQFTASTFVKAEPHGRTGVIRYLTKFADQVGQARAARLWDTFGSESIEILRMDPARVSSAGILSDSDAQAASESLAAVSALEATKIDLWNLFDRRGFHCTLVTACIQKWGAKAPTIIARNPYAMMLAELPSAGFRRCDKLYLDLGGRSDTLKRQMLCVWNSLREDNTGHTWFPRGSCLASIRHMIGSTRYDPDRAIALGVRAGWLTPRVADDGGQWIAETDKALNELAIADRLQPGKADALWSGAWREIDCEPSLTIHQRGKLEAATVGRIGILAGTPGTGKTFTAAQLIKWLVGKIGRELVAVCAPTGKAAVRITAAMQGYGITDLAATTIHRLLGVDADSKRTAGENFRFQHGPGRPLPYKVVVIDESSMLDTDLAAALLGACATGTHILFVGDPYQLPPVGHGAPLRDMIAAGIPCGELSEIHRNAGLIVRACAAIKDGRPFKTADKYDPESGQNLRHLEVSTGDDLAVAQVETLKALLTKLRTTGTFDPVWDVQILVAVNARSAIGRIPLNKVLQAELNPYGHQATPNVFRIGDKIICLKNTRANVVRKAQTGAPADVDGYEPANAAAGESSQDFVANGEIGRVLAVSPGVTIARFSNQDRTIKIPMGRAREEGEPVAQEDGAKSSAGCDYDLAYACTCHKLQGSEAPVVIVMVDDSPGAKMVCSREWVYTALSRASKLCVTIGRKAAVEKFVRRVSLGQRKTFLKELLAR